MFNLSHGFNKATGLDYEREQLYEWELLMICHYLATFVGYRYCICRYITFLVCHLIKKDNVIKGSSDYNCTSSSR